VVVACKVSLRVSLVLLLYYWMGFFTTVLKVCQPFNVLFLLLISNETYLKIVSSVSLEI